MKVVKRLADEKELSEDEQKSHDKNIDELTKEMTGKVEQHVKNKQSDVLGV
jgi:ribosome recycling factor